MQAPQPWHSAELTSQTWRVTFTEFSRSVTCCKLSAPYGQIGTHWPQPEHFETSTCEICGSESSVSWLNMPMTLDAAAPAWATVSGMSLGPWAAPAR